MQTRPSTTPQDNESATDESPVDKPSTNTGLPLKAAKVKKEALSSAEIFEFLPAALEVEQTPASPMGRAIIWAIVLLFTIAGVWAWFGKVDIVAVASGKIIPSERVKQIQRVSFELQQRQMESLRMQAFEQWLADGRQGNPAITRLSDSTADRGERRRQQHLLDQQIAELTARLAAMVNEQARQQAERQMTQAEIDKKERVIPVLKQRVDALDTLQKKQFGSKLQYLELQQELIEEEQDALVQQARLKQLDASTATTRAQINTLIHEQRKNNLAQKQETDLQIAALEQEFIKAQQQLQQQQLTAPISGHIQQLAVHTVGGVVTPAQPLMLIVPKQSQLEVEAMILNKDIGFVEEGMNAAVKIDTFNFTKYGLIEGEIIKISEDAIQDENLGLVYSARVKLKEDKLLVENKWVRLSPGMSATSEIKTGQRRLIEYFLSPLLRYRQESIRER